MSFRVGLDYSNYVELFIHTSLVFVSENGRNLREAIFPSSCVMGCGILTGLTGDNSPFDASLPWHNEYILSLLKIHESNTY